MWLSAPGYTEGIAMHVELPDALASEVEAVYHEAGYASRTDFVRDATRRRVEELTE